MLIMMLLVIVDICTSHNGKLVNTITRIRKRDIFSDQTDDFFKFDSIENQKKNAIFKPYRNLHFRNKKNGLDDKKNLNNPNVLLAPMADSFVPRKNADKLPSLPFPSDHQELNDFYKDILDPVKPIEEIPKIDKLNDFYDVANDYKELLSAIEPKSIPKEYEEMDDYANLKMFDKIKKNKAEDKLMSRLLQVLEKSLQESPKLQKAENTATTSSMFPFLKTLFNGKSNLQIQSIPLNKSSKDMSRIPYDSDPTISAYNNVLIKIEIILICIGIGVFCILILTIATSLNTCYITSSLSSPNKKPPCKQQRPKSSWKENTKRIWQYICSSIKCRSPIKCNKEDDQDRSCSNDKDDDFMTDSMCTDYSQRYPSSDAVSKTYYSGPSCKPHNSSPSERSNPDKRHKSRSDKNQCKSQKKGPHLYLKELFSHSPTAARCANKNKVCRLKPPPDESCKRYPKNKATRNYYG